MFKILGVIAAIIAIFVFITGKQHIRELFNLEQIASEKEFASDTSITRDKHEGNRLTNVVQANEVPLEGIKKVRGSYLVFYFNGQEKLIDKVDHIPFDYIEFSPSGTRVLAHRGEFFSFVQSAPPNVQKQKYMAVIT